MKNQNVFDPDKLAEHSREKSAISQCSVSSVGVVVNFHSDVDLYDFFNTRPYTQYIPDLIVSKKLALSTCELRYQNNNERTLRFQSTNVDIAFPWAMMKEGETLLYMSYPLTEFQRQKLNSSTIHAACVSINGHGILLLGNSWSGKTSLSLKLAQNYDAKIHATDLAVIRLISDKLFCLGGTKYIDLRLDTVKKSFPSLLHMFGNNQKDSWMHKVHFKTGDMGLTEGKDSVEIKTILRIHVDETRNTVHLIDANDLQTRLYLNEAMSRYIRNTTTTMTGGENYELLGYVPSFDRPEFYDWRQRAIELMVGSIGTMYAFGSSDLIAAYIFDQCINKVDGRL